MGFFQKKRITKSEDSLDYVKKLDELKASLETKEPEKSAQEFYKILQKSFQKKFKIKHQFTYEELIEEIKHKRIEEAIKASVTELCENLINTQYGGSSIHKDQLENLIEVTQDILNEKTPREILKEPEPITPKPEPKKEENLPGFKLKKPITHHLKKGLSALKPKKSEDLPVFKDAAEENLQLKQNELSTDVKDILQVIKKEKNGLDKELKGLKKTEKEINQEIERIDELEKEGPHPKLKAARQIMETKQATVVNNEAYIQERHESLNVREDTLKKMQQELTEMYVQVNADKKALMEKEKDLFEKDRIITQIKAELETKNKQALNEINNFKKELKEKETNFEAIRDFYRERENKLSVEESNLLDEKRKYIKFLENNIEKHKTILEKDLLHTNKDLENKEKKDEYAQTELVDYESKILKMHNAKELLKKELILKEEHFKNMENQIRAAQPKLEKLYKEISEKEKWIIQQENEVAGFEKRLKLFESDLKEKEDQLDMRDLEIQEVDNEALKLKLIIEEKKSDIEIREKSLEKNNKAVERLAKDVENDLKNREIEIKKLETRINHTMAQLKERGKINSKLKESLEHLEMKIEKTEDNSEYIRHKILISDGPLVYKEPGTPGLLELFSLLGKAKKKLSNNESDSAKRIYSNINDIYDRLNDIEKDSAFKEVTKVFKPKPDRKSIIIHSRHFDMDEITDDSIERVNIDLLITELQSALQSKRYERSKDVYNRLQRAYKHLPIKEKDRYYPIIMNLYSKAQTII